MVSAPSINLQDPEELLIQLIPKINKPDELNPCLFSPNKSLRMFCIWLKGDKVQKIVLIRKNVRSQSTASESRNLDHDICKSIFVGK